jgi:hypothetical protein
VIHIDSLQSFTRTALTSQIIGAFGNRYTTAATVCACLIPAIVAGIYISTLTVTSRIDAKVPTQA